MAWYDDYIAMIPGVQGGAPVIRDTRTPVRSIVLYARAYRNDLPEVQRALPHLTHDQINAALAYYADHRSIIDADIRRQEQALQQLLATR